MGRLSWKINDGRESGANRLVLAYCLVSLFCSSLRRFERLHLSCLLSRTLHLRPLRGLDSACAYWVLAG